MLKRVQRLIEGGPTLNWASIQPVLLEARCDIALFLDCCNAGQAVRPHVSHSVEFLAAANKDQMTPAGHVSRWPSFTKALIEETPRCLKDDGFVTLPELQKRMVRHESGLRCQPLYVP